MLFSHTNIQTSEGTFGRVEVHIEFVFEQQVLFRADSLCDFQPYGLMPWGGARGQT